jgi:hypothetical protein
MWGALVPRPGRTAEQKYNNQGCIQQTRPKERCVGIVKV